jgi:hypothetical protein
VIGPKHPEDLHKKTLVLDLDETLVHSSFKPIPNPDYIIPVEIDGRLVDVYVLKRPWLDHFLNAVSCFPHSSCGRLALRAWQQQRQHHALCKCMQQLNNAGASMNVSLHQHQAVFLILRVGALHLILTTMRFLGALCPHMQSSPIFPSPSVRLTAHLTPSGWPSL